jgi:cobalamin biosynthesis Co2+ chelatase CbiK
MKTLKQIYNQLPNDFMELAMIGEPLLDGNNDSKKFKRQISGKYKDLNEVRETVAKLIFSKQN